MLPLSEQFEVWTSQLTKSVQNVDKFVEEIKERILLIKSIDDRCKVAAKMFATVCSLVRDGKQNFVMFTQVFLELNEFILENYWLNYLNRLNYYLTNLIIKDLWDEALKLLPLLKIRCHDNPEIIKTYFDIYRNKYARFVTCEKLTKTQTKEFTCNLHELFQRALDTDHPLFIDLLSGTFEIKRNCITKCLENNWDSFDEWLDGLGVLIQNVENIKDLDKIYTNLTTIIYVLLSVEQTNAESYTKTLSIIKSCLRIQFVKNNQMYGKILNLYYNFVKLFSYTNDTDYFSKNLSDLLKQFRVSFELEKFNEIWYMDSVVTFIELIALFGKQIFSSINAECLVELNQMLKYLMTFLRNINYKKTFCSHCDTLKRHAVLNVTETSAYMFRRAIELQCEDVAVPKFLLTMIKYLLSVVDSFNCKNLNYLLDALFINILKSFSKVDSQSYCQLAIEILDELRKYKTECEVMAESRLVYYYRKLYSSTKRFQEMLEVYAVSILHILSREDITREKILNEFAHFNNTYENASCPYSSSICDILDKMSSKGKFKTPKYDKYTLLTLQLESCLKYDDNEELTQTLFIQSMKLCKNEFDFADLVSKIGKIEIPDLETKVKTAVRTLKSNERSAKNRKCEAYLALAQLNYRLNLFALDRQKKLFNTEKLSDESLELLDRDLFKKVDTSVENNLIESCLKTVEYYESFYLSIQTFEEPENIDWNCILDCLSYLARVFDLYGYILNSYRSWILINKMSIKVGDSFNKIRAISYFAEYSYILREYDKNFDLEEKMDAISEELLENFEKIELHLPRRQNYILSCILNIAIHYLREGKHEASYGLFEMVNQRRKDLEKARNCKDLICAKVYAYKFRYVWMHPSNETQISPNAYVYHILEAIRDIRHYTSEDSINIPAFLFTIIPEVTYFLLNRLISSSAKSYLYMLLKFALSIGTAFRTAQILSLLAKVDLQLESLENCQPKLVILDTILMNESVKIMDTTFVGGIEVKNLKTPTHFATPYDQIFETRRKAVCRPSPVQNFKLPISDSEDLTKRYLVQHKPTCKCDYCRNKLMQIISFESGCLQGRRQYVSGDYIHSERFFEQCFEYWNKNVDPILELMWHNSCLWMMSYYVNSLRRIGKFQKAIDICNLNIEFCEKHRHILDIAYKQNFLEQKISSMYEMTDKTNSNRKTNSTNIKLIKKELKFSPMSSVKHKQERKKSGSISPKNVYVAKNHSSKETLKSRKLPNKTHTVAEEGKAIKSSAEKLKQDIINVEEKMSHMSLAATTKALIHKEERFGGKLRATRQTKCLKTSSDINSNKIHIEKLEKAEAVSSVTTKNCVSVPKIEVPVKRSARKVTQNETEHVMPIKSTRLRKKE